MLKNIGLAITGSFCTHAKILQCAKQLVSNGYNVLPIVTSAVQTTNTRFGSAKKFLENLKDITGNAVIKNIVEAEPIGPQNKIDLLVIAPTTGNTLSKLALGITDNAVTMVCKAHLRNNKPVVIGISSNDALGANATNLAKLINSKNIFFVPFWQDDAQNKPKSLIANWELLEQTILKAYEGKQLQPLVLQRK